MGEGAGMGEAEAAFHPAVAPLPLPLGSADLLRALEFDRVGVAWERDRVGGVRERSWERERMGAGAGMGEAASPHSGPDDHVAAALDVLCDVRPALAILMSESRAVPWELRVGPFLILPACDDRVRAVG